MPVFHVYLNGKRVSSAGVGGLGVLGAHVSWVRRVNGEFFPKKQQGKVVELLQLHVGGLDTPADEHLRWLDRNLKVGDEIRIEVIADGKIDKPRSRQKRDPAKDLRAQKQYVKDMAKKFGWKIQTR